MHGKLPDHGVSLFNLSPYQTFNSYSSMKFVLILSFALVSLNGYAASLQF